MFSLTSKISHEIAQESGSVGKKPFAPRSVGSSARPKKVEALAAEAGLSVAIWHSDYRDWFSIAEIVRQGRWRVTSCKKDRPHENSDRQAHLPRFRQGDPTGMVRNQWPGWVGQLHYLRRSLEALSWATCGRYESTSWTYGAPFKTRRDCLRKWRPI